MHVFSPQSSQSTQRNLFSLKFSKTTFITRWLSAVSVVKYLRSKWRELWQIRHPPHNIARGIKTLKPSNLLHANVPNAAKSKKSFQMNSIVRTTAESATNPSTFRNVSWSAKVKAFLHANGLQLNRQLTGTHLKKVSSDNYRTPLSDNSEYQPV